MAIYLKKLTPARHRGRCTSRTGTSNSPRSSPASRGANGMVDARERRRRRRRGRRQLQVLSAPWWRWRAARTDFGALADIAILGAAGSPIRSNGSGPTTIPTSSARCIRRYREDSERVTSHNHCMSLVAHVAERQQHGRPDEGRAEIGELKPPDTASRKCRRPAAPRRAAARRSGR